MTRNSKIQVNTHLKREIERGFVKTLSDLKSVEQLSVFVHDFFSESEIESMTKRLAIAYWLKKGRSYRNIIDNLKVSAATVASVQESMNKEGFKLALKQLEAEEWANKWSERIKRIVKTSPKQHPIT